jgi:hypothetical protein
VIAEMETALEANAAIVGLVSSLISWAGFLTLVWLLQNAREETQRWLIRGLVNRDMALEELYQEMSSARERRTPPRS